RAQLEPMLEVEKTVSRRFPRAALEVAARTIDVSLRQPHQVADANQRRLGVAIAAARRIAHIFLVRAAQLAERAQVPEREHQKNAHGRELPSGARGLVTHDAFARAELFDGLAVLAGEIESDAAAGPRP